MRKVSTDSIGPDDIVAVDVISSSGNVLLEKGAAITPALGRRLRNWGIAHVYVEGEDRSGQSVKTTVRSPVEIKSELYDMFLGTLDNGRMKKIFDAACTHKLQKQGKA
ncbi:MAG: hypothetical protein LBC70_04940 [Chitinispirillales bacterium]|jgi:hypothetical protein|nr:hypothetical protein [Chitinispirillales bacterium]